MHPFLSRRTAYVVVGLTILAAMSGSRTGDPMSVYALAGVAVAATLFYGVAWGVYHKGKDLISYPETGESA